ncbi:MAG TPA: CRISPR-associated helicase Cas3' [Verrucomicrobiae bacterium]|nr:CRISPR-associated helicase Cas3' [Verrucomicrobiae bacterium]
MREAASPAVVEFEAFFQQATGKPPYPYQFRLATDGQFPQLLDIPTGLGKTAAIVLAWLYRRRFATETIRRQTPRRLVMVLPMRVLVEQTRDNAKRWIEKLNLSKQVSAHVLMGGEEADDWDLFPERDTILIGTQDMLLSRALNRGYGLSRYRWPMHFGLLHTDCLWVFDEIQLMGSGLATTAQLEAFRKKFTSNGCASIWMSATLQRDWLKTVDFDPSSLQLEQLSSDDLANQDVQQRCKAAKPLQAAARRMDDPKGLADEIAKAHGKAGGRTLAVVNTVARARDLFRQVEKRVKSEEKKPALVLIHSRFRPQERAERVRQLLAEPGAHGMIVVSTQVVEAGVDVSATTLFTELAPWALLVQRFGRCNRRGEENEKARTFWIDLPADKKLHAKFSAPYEPQALTDARRQLQDCKDVGPASLPKVNLPYRHGQVIRQRDFIELFDTTPDLAGNDIDIERYVREVDECDVQVFWREWPVEQVPPEDMGGPRRDELCAVPAKGDGGFADFVKDSDRRKLAWRWDYLDERWVVVESNRIFPGQIYLLHATAGGYEKEIGWDAKAAKPVDVVPASTSTQQPDSNDADQLSQFAWQSIAEHTDRVCRELDAILAKLEVTEVNALKLAARWHDRGKAHTIFRQAIRTALADGKPRPNGWSNRPDIAKAPKGWWQKYERKHFRHELASALAALMVGDEFIPAKQRDLVTYLVAAHHGKVRLSIRSLPEEMNPGNNRRFARGVWDDDELPATDLGNGVLAPAIKLSLEPMELGQSEDGQPSWAERMLWLRDTLGLFHLAYLEAILRAADIRASRDNNPPEVNNA